MSSTIRDVQFFSFYARPSSLDSMIVIQCFHVLHSANAAGEVSLSLFKKGIVNLHVWNMHLSRHSIQLEYTIDTRVKQQHKGPFHHSMVSTSTSRQSLAFIRTQLQTSLSPPPLQPAPTFLPFFSCLASPSPDPPFFPPSSLFTGCFLHWQPSPCPRIIAVTGREVGW